MAEVIWLASYPKSGNTWFRAILTALARGDGETPDVNGLVGSMLVGWPIVETALGVNPTELTDDELLRLRPLFIRDWATEIDGDHVYVKTHDALGTERYRMPAVPADVTRAALYLVRNPLDVCVSYAHHSGVTPDQMALRINNPEMLMARPRRRIGRQIPQPTGSWSDHVDSWTVDPPFTVHTVRYEDLVAAPQEHVLAATQAIGLDHTADEVAAAVAATEFDRLVDREREGGFREKAPGSERFFRRGEVGAWRDELGEDGAHSIVECHSATMTRLGYLDAETGELLV